MHVGAFPLWLAPVQVRFLVVTDAVQPYVSQLAQRFRHAGVRVEICSGGCRCVLVSTFMSCGAISLMAVLLATGESLGKLVRTAEKAKIPVMCVVGNKEAETDTLAVRTYGGGRQSDIQSEEVLDRVLRAVSSHGNF